jgi:2-dehydro-3-deoxyphosphogluconate aldolase/(4S)-4-hydroxy-2-oxoglutarate aldolase
VSLETIGDCFRAGSGAVGVGSELVDAALMKGGRFDLVEERACQFLEAARRRHEEEQHSPERCEHACALPAKVR